ncbi:MAG TPA: C25 family cysteine peptidase, partial [Candidatus Udaeobacter sp.]|nr:C25 family cysteine peptidase [Candidatus Udaeobacter sp.]
MGTSAPPIGRGLGRALLVLAGLAALAAARPAAAVPYRAIAVGEDYRVAFAPEDVKLESTPAGTRVELRDGIDPEDPAAPALPTITVVVEIPAELTVEQVSSTVEGEEVLAQGITLAAAGAPARIDDPPAPPAAVAPARLAAPWPAASARVLGESFGRGHRLVAVELAPVRWIPASQSLARASAIRFRLHLAPAADRPLAQTRVVPAWEADYAATLAQSLGQPLPEAARAVGAPVRNRLTVTFPPSANGAPVAYVIVTSEAMRAPFESLAIWKTQKGRNAVVVTREWIASQYPNGADPAEQLRFFLKDAYQHWGTLFVLLGGDTEIVPARLVVSTLFASPEDPATIPTDLYYACLDGNWNQDGDDRVGEAITDNVDLVPELFVGRAPVSTLAEAATFVQRTLQHEQAPPTNGLFPASIVFMAEHLGFMDGAT